ncbi:PIG-L family deacetylase [Vibrio metoecus]|uniref:PIG-L family deacetylase n=1 Tax=Vibrio metoecus TaxID=1481663 RepID=UPI00130257E1|nr:PIG-L family deacetylase [Vibrio metoecus]
MLKSIITLSLLLAGFAAQAVTLPTGTTVISQLPSASNNADLSPSEAGARNINFSYCLKNERKLIVIAHADDDRYFMGDDIRNAISNGACVKIIHINAGFDILPPKDANSYSVDDPYYYQGRINGAKAVYSDFLSRGFEKSIYQTESWDTVNGNTIQRYILSTELNGKLPQGQMVEIQIFGLPNSSNVVSSSGSGKTISHLYTDHNETTLNVANHVANYQVTNEYTWDNVLSTLDLIISWMNPTEILTLDPWGVPGDDGFEGQHPDHIMAARIVQSTAYASQNPNKVKYFKTYNVNTFSPNLSTETAEKTNTDVANHFQHDWGSSFVTDSACSEDAATNPTSWACKQYQATPKEYFVAKNIENSAGQCLSVTNNNAVTWEACGASSLAVTLTKPRYAFVVNPNDTTKTWVLSPSSNELGAQINLIPYLDMPQNTRWHFNDATQKMEFLFTNSDQKREALCLGSSSDNTAVLETCSEAVDTTPADGSAVLASNEQFSLKNEKSGQCLALDSNGQVTMVNCQSNGTLWKFNHGELSQSFNGQEVCLNSPTFGGGVAKITTKECHSTSQGQRFDIRMIEGTSLQLVTPINDNVCLESDLNLYPCHGYQVQQWRVQR